MDAPTDVYDCLAETLDGRLGSVSHAAARHRLESDRSLARSHSRVADQPVTYGQASFCRECGEPAPCDTIRRLAEEYGCTDL
jgi:hypothetical protein